MVYVHLIFSLFVCSMYAVSAETTSGFTNANSVRTALGIVPAPVNQSLVRQWLFPNITFTCNGNITRWIFRAEVGPGPGSNNGRPELPLMNVWRENAITPLNSDDYVVVHTSGSEEELVGDGPVYQYILNPPVEVQEGDVFGIFLPYDGSERLRLLFSDMGDGGAPTSYRRNSDGTIFNTMNAIFVTDDRYIPLVTAVIGEVTSISPSPYPEASSPRSPSLSSSSTLIRQPSPTSTTMSPDEQPSPTSTATSSPDGQPKDSSDLPTPIVVIISVGAVVVLMVISIAVVAGICMVRKKYTKTMEVTANEAYGLQPQWASNMKDNEAYGFQPQWTSSMQDNEAYGLQPQRTSSMQDNEAYGLQPQRTSSMQDNEAYGLQRSRTDSNYSYDYVPT